jgi:hypothetical protein
MEPLPGVEPGDVSIPRTRGRRSEGHELAGLESNQRPRTVQCRSAPADRATGQWSPRRVPPSARRTYKVRPVLGPRGPVCQAGFEPATSRPSTWRLSLLGYKHMEPPPGADPGHPPYEGEAAAVRGGNAGHPGFEPGNSGSRARRVCRFPQWPLGAEGASRTRKPRGIPVPFTPAWCATRDLNPDRHRLRACRSAIELAAPGADGGSRTRIASLEGWCLMPFGHVRTVVPP